VPRGERRAAGAQRSGSHAGVIPILAAAVLWGTTGTAASFLPADVSPLATGAATMAIGGLLLFALSAQDALRTLADPVVRRWLLAGVAGIFVYPLAFYTSMHLAGVAIGTVVSLGSAPVFAAALEYLVERRAVSPRWTACTAVALVGTVMLLAGRSASTGATQAADSQAGSPASVAMLGVLLGLVAGLSYAMYTDASRRLIGAGHGSRATMGALFGLAAVLLVPVLLVTGGPLLQSAGSVGITAYLAIGPMFIAYLLFGRGLRTVRASTATTITLAEPLVATVLAVLVVGERFTPLGWAGLALVLAGVAFLVAQPATPERAGDNNQLWAGATLYRGCVCPQLVDIPATDATGSDG
jgi:drug/metabolite transporter, DME family